MWARTAEPALGPRVLAPVLRCGQAAGVLGAHEAWLQRALTAFLAEGLFERHTRRLHRVYGARREVLAAALCHGLGDRGPGNSAGTGMHLVVRLAGAGDEADVLRRAAARGVAAYSLSSFYWREPARPGLGRGYGALPEPALAEAAQILGEAIRAATLRSGSRAPANVR